MAGDPRRGTGRRGEAIASAHLERLGFTILARNYRTREGEIDLIACRRRTLVFCEVKALVSRRRGPASGPASPLEGVGPAKRIQVRRIARSWLAEDNPGPGARRWRELRFDAIGVLLSPTGRTERLEHVENAF